MGLDIYWVGLCGLTFLAIVVAGYPYKKNSNRILRWVWIWMRCCYRGRWSKDDELKTEHSCSSSNNNPYGTHLVDRGREAGEFRHVFLSVYLLVMGSEWLQNPYTYSLFRQEKSLSESTVANLYIVTYASAAVSAFFAGYLTDRFGRRSACLAFCVVHSVAAVSVCADHLAVLVGGRVLAGVALTLLWTAFESWMLAEWNARGLGRGGEEEGDGMTLGEMFSLMTTANCTTAIIAGVLGHCVVLALGSKTNPFLLGVALDLSAAVLMLRTWNENRGVKSGSSETSVPAITDIRVSRYEDDNIRQSHGAQQQLKKHSLSSYRKLIRLTNPLLDLWVTTDVRVWIISFATCCFEGTLFLFLFFWPGALQDAHNRQHQGREENYQQEEETIPHGVIFASFMASMVLGAMLFGLLVTARGTNTNIDSSSGATTKSTWEKLVASDDDMNNSSHMKTTTRTTISKLVATLPTILLTTAIFLASIAFGFAAIFAKAEGQGQEKFLYAVFLLLEACNGVYVPTIAVHRGMIVSDEARARIYGIMNIPLFLFVVLALRFTDREEESGGGGRRHLDEGEGEGGERGVHRQLIFGFCAVLLFIAALVVGSLLFMEKREEESQAGIIEIPDSEEAGRPSFCFIEDDEDDDDIEREREVGYETTIV
ncbi:hypothetical protein F5Y16DRAFT_28216 [Xylariaceae sp. FL0255]|nr:hypothetical protein F5Y16DRAFT_28216 [Xylariaceae sp. FL0255]